MSKYCLFLIVIYYLTGGNNSMSRFCKFGKLHVTKGNVDKLLGILLTASKELKRSLAPTGNFCIDKGYKFPLSARDPL